MLPYWADAAESSLKALLGLIPSVLQDASKLHSRSRQPLARSGCAKATKRACVVVPYAGKRSRSVAPLSGAHQADHCCIAPAGVAAQT